MTEVQDLDSQQRHRELTLPGPGGMLEERYHLTGRRGPHRLVKGHRGSPRGWAGLRRHQFDKVTDHESHDEAGNAPGTARTSTVAVNHAALVGSTRQFAESCRARPDCPALGRHPHVLHGRGGPVLVVASLNNHPFLDGYLIQTDPGRLPSGRWLETFNSDSATYGGANVGNLGAAIPADDGRIRLLVPANGVLVLQRS